jgi:hypothetical protein
MRIVRQMSARLTHTVDEMTHRPSDVELSFGIKFDAEAGALIAKAGVEAAVSVTLRWRHGGAE